MKNSINSTARIGGMLYLIIIASGMFGELVLRGKLIISGNAAVTAANITAHELLWRLGIAIDLLMHICDIPLMLIIFILLRPVNRNLAVLALLFNIVQTAVLVANKLNLLAALFQITGAGNLKALNSQQLYNLGYLSIKLHDYGFGLGLIFFGCACLVYGYLIYRSGYLPGALGILIQIAGLCYLTSSFTLIIAPSIANVISPAILLPCFIGELSLCLWLLIKGVYIAKWNERNE